MIFDNCLSHGVRKVMKINAVNNLKALSNALEKDIYNRCKKCHAKMIVVQVTSPYLQITFILYKQT